MGNVSHLHAKPPTVTAAKAAKPSTRLWSRRVLHLFYHEVHTQSIHKNLIPVIRLEVQVSLQERNRHGM